MVLNASFPDDYVVATGRSHSVEEFCKKAFDIIGQDYTKWVEVDEEFLRPSEVPYLRGDASRIKKELCWEPDTPFHRLVAEMVNYDIDEIKSNKNA
jgi:GDPmannose 4,6-dehydratase